MYRLLGRVRPAPQNSRRSARATANEAALETRENRPSELVEGTMEQPSALTSWEASDQRKNAKRHP